MALKNRAIAALCFVVHTHVISAQESQGRQPLPRLPPLGTVSSIQITRATAENAVGEKAPCTGMRPLAERDVRHFLGHARPISRRAALHDHFLTGDCYTEARLTFKDGRVATLGIANDAGTARLTPVVQGKEQEHGHHLRCAQCAGLLDLPGRLPPQ